MHSLFQLTAACLCVRHVASVAVELQRRDDNITLAAPVVAVPSQYWDGTAGTWSSFAIHAGTPENAYRVMPATSWQETWLIFGNDVERVCNTSLGVPSSCQQSRGGVFDNSTSTSWNVSFKNLPANGNQFDLGLDENLGESGGGIYGFDVVGLGFATGQGPTVNRSILAEIVSNTWWLGLFGMGFQPTNFSGYADPQPSFASAMFSQGLISSKTWSYTAGAFYRLKGVYGSLVFGGYDASRFVPNDVRFTMAPDISRDIVLSIRQIVSTTKSGNTTLMSTADLFFIDSAVTEIWLPKTVCQAFENAFGIALDPTYGIYLLSDSTRESLRSLNPNVTFTLGDQLTGGNTVDVTLPYAAFDHNITAPLYNGSSWWFPLMQATDSTQYTLGRTFLQEAYVTANYHTKTFNVSQAVFNDESVASQIIAIPSFVPSSSLAPNGTSGGGTGNSSKKPSKGAIAGIIIAVIVVLFAASITTCFCLGWLCFRRRKNARPTSPVHEIGSGKRVGPKASAYQSQASRITSEISGQDAKVEIMGNPVMHPQELEADVPIDHGNKQSRRVSGPSDSSRATEDSNMSSLLPITEHKTPMAELGPQERGLGYSTTGMVHEDEHAVSPNSPSMPHNSMMGRAGPAVTVNSPVSTPSEATWSPSSPLQRSGTSGSRFHERWEN